MQLEKPFTAARSRLSKESLDTVQTDLVDTFCKELNNIQDNDENCECPLSLQGRIESIPFKYSRSCAVY